MYSNIGRKIKFLAKALFLIQTIGGVIVGALLLESIELLALLIMVVVPLIAWISSWFLYGFGELIDKTCDIERNTRGSQGNFAAQATGYERINQIEQLRSQGLITEEEYRQAISQGQ